MSDRREGTCGCPVGPRGKEGPAGIKLVPGMREFLIRDRARCLVQIVEEHVIPGTNGSYAVIRKINEALDIAVANLKADGR